MIEREVRGPVAPRDPVKKRPFYYIMRKKKVLGSPQADGRGIQFIYESDGRLEASAKLVGNLTDETMIRELSTAEGFKKQVNSIGVVVTRAGEPVNVRFAFQMYGVRDPYASGTTLYMDTLSDGMERVLDLSNADWYGDDRIPGQIRFEFETAGLEAEVSVCLYLNDGYTAPQQTEDKPIDFKSDKYRAIIERSILQKGNIHRVKSALERARKGEEVTVAFIGGSITQGAGAIPINSECYARKIFEGFCNLTDREYDDNVKYVKAGLGGTPSELGMLRYDRDVLAGGRITPDVVIVEFAVNDEGDETQGDCFDSLVRKIYNGPGNPAVILLFSVFADDGNLEERLKPVGFAYNLPMVSIKQAVTPQFYKSEEEGRVITKSQFFYDMYHPTNAGHRIMADSVLRLFKLADESEDMPELSIADIKPPKSADFEDVYFVGRDDINNSRAIRSFNEGAFLFKDTELHRAERNMDLFGTPEFPDNWMYDGNKAEGREATFTLNVFCRRLLLTYMDSASPKVGTVVVTDNGKEVLKIDPHIVGWTHANARIIVRNDEPGEHEIKITVPTEDIGRKFTILGFGIVD